MFRMSLQEDVCVPWPHTLWGGRFERLKKLQGSQQETCRGLLSLGFTNSLKLPSDPTYVTARCLGGLSINLKHLQSVQLGPSEGPGEMVRWDQQWANMRCRQKDGHTEQSLRWFGPGEGERWWNRDVLSLEKRPPYCLCLCVIWSVNENNTDRRESGGECVGQAKKQLIQVWLLWICWIKDHKVNNISILTSCFVHFTRGCQHLQQRVVIQQSKSDLLIQQCVYANLT